MNSVQLIGRLTRDPELRSTHGGTSVCDMRLAVPRRRTRSGEDRGAVFIDVTAFGGLAESCGAYLSSGRRVAVSGRLELEEWEGPGGEPRRRHKVVADQVEFLDPKDAGQRSPDGEEVSEEGAGDEDIPF